ncbi:A/G-specific adenine glycosylase [Dermabacter hominis]|uniref:A/G-specific adenine glycosylase n=1 Tax=Dermabacter TaxID=36739 RepID=UPI00290FC264|nr:A/G-specific adenine glycosylase [Dermabacter sp.]MDK8803431.1 A/G-specific adenine glycosylase [Dermabacter hominis]MDU4922988.1 A/G-specific adenine glycosylase [Dermabacter sp.]
MCPRPDLYDPLATWFASQRRPLPWREEGTSAWGVLVSEIMSQQTPVSRVVEPWRAWMTRWPTPRSLALADSAEVLRAWGSLGYPRRALRLLECARTIDHEHSGELPVGVDALRELPGIGDYTAAAVANFAQGQKACVLDTNIRRVLTRVLDAKPSPTAHVTKRDRARFETLVPASAESSRIWNEGIMELGALVCRARNPRCEACPLAEQCAWLKAGRPGLGERTTRPQGYEGTDRQIRGRILKTLREGGEATVGFLERASGAEPERFTRLLTDLLAEGFVSHTAGGLITLGAGTRAGGTATNA